MVTRVRPHDDDLSEKVLLDDVPQSNVESISTDRSNSGATTTNSKGEKSSSPTSSPMLETKDQDSKFSLAMAPAALFPPTPTRTPTSNRPSPLDSSLDKEPSNWKQRAAGGRTRGKKKVSVLEEQTTLTECLESRSHSNLGKTSHAGFSPSIEPDQPRTNDALESIVNDIIDDDCTEQIRIKMDENPLSSLIFAAELVENDEKARDFVPGGNLWESEVQEEFETRLLTLEQNIAVAEVVTKQTSSSTKRLWMTWGLLLILIAVAGAIVAGLIKNKGDQSPQQVIENRGQKQVRLRDELTQRTNRTNSDGDLKPFDDPTSPQSLALEWLLNDTITLTENAVTQKVLDRYVLAVLYYSTDGPQWRHDVGSYFLLEQDVCDWNTGIPWKSAEPAIFRKDANAWTYLIEVQNETVGGVYCQGAQDEIRLSLFGCGLNGTLPWELSLLSNVVSLQLAGNAFEGTIPPELGQLSSLLDLYVNYNMLTGTMPTELGLLTVLQRLDISYYNTLTGTLPTELALLTELQSLDISYNTLTGTLPTELGHLTALQYFSVYNNTLTGTLPTELGLLTVLQRLDIPYNTLTGTLPTELGLLTALQAFDVYSNTLTGTLPTELGHLTALQYFSVYNNTLTGTLPTELGLLTGLQWFWVNDNRLTGTLPTELGRLRDMQEFGVSDNTLTGTLPTELGQLTALLYLALYNNALTGTLPRSLGYLTNVEYLDVEVNNLTGTLPTELGLLTALQIFWVSSNTLTGTLPTELGRLTNLFWLYMYNNKLTGPLPTELGQLTALSEFRIFNNSLTGTLPTEMDPMVSLEFLDVSNNFFTGTVPLNLADNLGTNFSFDGNNFTTGN